MEANCARGLGLAVLLAVSAAFAQPRQPPTGEGARVELWTEPLGAVFAGVLTATGPLDSAYLPLGVTWRAHPGARPWTVELAPYLIYDTDNPQDSASRVRPRNYGARLSAGPVYGAGPGESGGFVQTLATLQLHRFDAGAASSVGLGLEWGADVGYRFQLGRLSLTPLFGLGVGVGFGLKPMASHEPAYWTVQASMEGRTLGPIFLVNVTLDLLRVGYTF
jgi:hypothetical protein